MGAAAGTQRQKAPPALRAGASVEVGAPTSSDKDRSLSSRFRRTGRSYADELLEALKSKSFEEIQEVLRAPPINLRNWHCGSCQSQVSHLQGVSSYISRTRTSAG
eukprot:5796950-Pyramimonas_sp.AAC.1